MKLRLHIQKYSKIYLLVTILLLTALMFIVNLSLTKEQTYQSQAEDMLINKSSVQPNGLLYDVKNQVTSATDVDDGLSLMERDLYGTDYDRNACESKQFWERVNDSLMTSDQCWEACPKNTLFCAWDPREVDPIRGELLGYCKKQVLSLEGLSEACVWIEEQQQCYCYGDPQKAPPTPTPFPRQCIKVYKASPSRQCSESSMRYPGWETRGLQGYECEAKELTTEESIDQCADYLIKESRNNCEPLDCRKYTEEMCKRDEHCYGFFADKGIMRHYKKCLEYNRDWALACSDPNYRDLMKQICSSNERSVGYYSCECCPKEKPKSIEITQSPEVPVIPINPDN